MIDSSSCKLLGSAVGWTELSGQLVLEWMQPLHSEKFVGQRCVYVAYELNTKLRFQKHVPDLCFRLAELHRVTMCKIRL